MKRRINILFALLFVASLAFVGCSKDPGLTPVSPQGELRGGDDGDDSDNGKGDNGGITDPGDDDDDEGGSSTLTRQ